MWRRPECVVLCACADPCGRVQVAANEYLCVDCKSNMIEIVNGDARCLRDENHRVRPTARCLRKSPNCDRQSALLQCKVLVSVRPPQEGEVCGACKDPDGVQFVVAFAPCGHVLCLDCFPQNVTQGLSEEGYLRMIKSRSGAWVPACRLCKKSPDPGSCDFSTYRVLPKAAYDAICERATRMAIGEEEGIICPQCCAVNVMSEEEVRATARHVCAKPDCGAVICVPCRRLASVCIHSTDLAVVHTNFRTFASLNILMRCPRCGFGSLKDGACNHVECPSCDLSYCFACGRARPVPPGGVQHQPMCTRHPHIEFQDEVLQDKIVSLHANHWQNVFFLVRAYVLVRKFVSFLRPEQLEALVSQPCPMADLLVEKTDDYEIGSGVDKALSVSASGWAAFLDDAHRCSMECQTLVDDLYPEWFDDVTV